jgi:serine/threonine protein kinase
MGSLLEVVDYMHRLGICHRDLKPENIMFDPDDSTIKLIDFDISKNFLSNKEVEPEPEDMFTVTGTLSYKAPEMLKGGGYSCRVDIWALGVILYQLLTA